MIKNSRPLKYQNTDLLEHRDDISEAQQMPPIKESKH